MGKGTTKVRVAAQAAAGAEAVGRSAAELAEKGKQIAQTVVEAAYHGQRKGRCRTPRVE